MTASPKKTLGLWTLTALVTGNMIGSGVFLLPASLAAFGSISIISWCLTAAGALCLAMIFSRISRVMPKTGGPYAYCQAAYGDFIGFQVAFCYWVALWVGNAAIAVAFVGYLSVFFPLFAHSDFYALIASISVVWLLTLINIVGVREAGRVQVLTTILKLLPLVIIAFVGLFFIHPHYLTNFNVSGHSDFHAITGAATLTLWAFIGFESATVPAGNVINPRKNIARATMIGTGVAAVVYILGTVVVMGVVPMHALAQSVSPYAAAAKAIFGAGWGVWVITIAAVISCFGTLNGWVLLQGQVPMAAARDNLFPRHFAKTSRNGTPVFGLIISSLLITGLLMLRYGASLVDQFTFIILLATLATLIPYMYTAVAEVLLLLKAPEKANRKRLMPSLILATLGFVYVFWAISGAGRDIIYTMLLLLMASVPIYLIMKVRSQANSEN